KISGDKVMEYNADYLARFQTDDTLNNDTKPCDKLSSNFISQFDIRQIMENQLTDSKDVKGLYYWFGLDATENVNRMNVIFITNLDDHNLLVINHNGTKQYAAYADRTFPSWP